MIMIMPVSYGHGHGQLGPNERKGASKIMKTYRVVRFYREDHPTETIKEGLTLEEAQAHCNDPTTRREGEWFDGYEEEGKEDQQ